MPTLPLQMLRPLDAAFELGEALGGVAGCHVRAQVLDLQADRGHRRTQFMGRVLHEPALGLQGFAQPAEQ